jgi:hypothetical protein
MKAAEQYLLGELTGDLREQYEEHFFSCHECAEEVKVGVAFVGGAREVLGSENFFRVPPAPAKTDVQGWFAMLFRPAFAVPAMAILLAIVSYQNAILIPRMKKDISQTNAPQALASFSLIRENSRGGAPSTIIVPPNKPFGLYLDIPPGNFSSYICEMETESGTPEISLRLSQQEATETVQLLIPAGRLGPGRHILIVNGLGGSPGINGEGMEVVRYSIVLSFKQ